MFTGTMTQVFLTDLIELQSNQVFVQEYFNLSKSIEDAFGKVQKNIDLKAEFPNFDVMGEKTRYQYIILSFLNEC